MKKGIIFDLDGTLVDSLYFWNHIGSTYLRYKGILDDNIDNETNNMTIEEAASYIKNKYNIEESISFIRMQINCMIEEQYFHKLKLNDGVLEFVEYFYAHNYKLIIATDTPKPLAIAILKRYGIADYFIDVITTIKVKAAKDKPNIYDYCCLRMQLNKEDVVVYEDDNMAIDTLKKANYDVIGYGNNTNAIYKIESFKDEASYKMLEKMI